MKNSNESLGSILEREPGLQLNEEQAAALLEWLSGRRGDILASEEDLGGLDVLLPLLEEEPAEE